MSETSTTTDTRLHEREASPLRSAALAGFSGSLIVVATAPVRVQAAPAWRLTLPYVPHPGGRAFSIATFVLGVALLSFGWYRLVRYVTRHRGHGGARLAGVSLVVSLWALPIMLGPPLFSNDVYSYAAQGELASHGYDVTKWGPIALGGGPFLRAADEIWHHNPSPYGPVWNKLAAGVVTTTGHDPAAAVWGFRALIAASIVIAAVALALLARDLGADPAIAVALGIGNPLVLLHILGGIHNDGLMMALLLVGVYAMRRQRRWAALLLITAATAVKLPAAAGLVFLGWNWRGELDTRLKRLGGATVAAAVGMLLIVWLSIQIRMGMGWLGALRGTSRVLSTFAPVTMAGVVVTELLGLLGIRFDGEPIIGLFRLVGLVAAGWLAWMLLSHCRRLGTELALGLTLLIAIVLGPVMWPWYLPPAIAVLAATGAERFRPALMVACSGATLFVFPTSAQASLGSSSASSIVRMLLFVAIAAAAMAAQWWARQPMVPEALRRRLPQRLRPEPLPTT